MVKLMTPTATDAQHIIMTLVDSALHVERRLDRALSSIRGISFSEYRLLSRLASFHEQTAMRVDLAQAVGLTPSAVTRALKPLEKIGYVTTIKSSRDARRSLASLSPSGKTLLIDANSVVNDVAGEMPLEALNSESLVQFRSRLSGS